MEDGGWLWILIALGLVLLGVAIASGESVWRYRRRNRFTQARADAATQENYRKGG